MNVRLTAALAGVALFLSATAALGQTTTAPTPAASPDHTLCERIKTFAGFVPKTGNCLVSCRGLSRRGSFEPSPTPWATAESAAPHASWWSRL